MDAINSEAVLQVDGGVNVKTIAAAIDGLRAGDLLVIAGKGHETGQTVGDVTHPFDDAEVARQAVAALQRRPS